jgi:hypothetical protein
MTIQAKPESQARMIMGHCQPLFMAAKPPTIGPRQGPQTAPTAHVAMAYGSFGPGHCEQCQYIPSNRRGYARYLQG